MYYLVLIREQDLSLEDVNEQLRIVCDDYRDYEYDEDEIFNSYKKYGYYSIFESENYADVYDMRVELENESISTTIVDEEWIDVMQKKAIFDYIEGKKIVLTFEWDEYEIDFNVSEETLNKYSKLNRVALDKYDFGFKNNQIKHSLDLSINHLDRFDEFFKDKIIGQDNVLEKIKEQLIMISYDTSLNKNRPAGIFFFAGPTGVGKTETCKVLSEFLYNNQEINRFDMSEYKDDWSISKLIGAPNGLVGYEEGGTLINKMKKNPNAIVLFDEIEKAHKSIFDLFLQILDEGFVTSNKGDRISFADNIIIFTSNIGSNLIDWNMSSEEISNIFINSVDDFFSNKLNRPEILGRIGRDNIIDFNLINNKENLYKIVDIYFSKFISEQEHKKISLSFNKENVYDSILLNIDLTKGARDIRNKFDLFKKHFVKALYNNKLSYELLENKNIDFSYDGSKIIINKYE